MGTRRKKDGFNGQKAIVLPKNTLQLCEAGAITTLLYITDIGYYPKARFHFREREKGSNQNILIYCVDGAGWAVIDGIEVAIEKGQYLIIPQNSVHTYGADMANPWSIYWIHFKGKESGSIINKLTSNNMAYKGEASFGDKRLELFDEIYNTLELGYSIDRLHYASMLLWNYFATFCYPKLFNYSISKDEPVEIVIHHMLENTHKNLKLKDLAGLVYISPSHFSTLFKKKTGYPPLEYFNHIKIQKACRYLEFTNMHVKDICYNLGFNDPFYFSRLFHKQMGESPIEYRKRKKYT
ncbi:MAG: AraC family transcriptional regulator [Niabella sp.]